MRSFVVFLYDHANSCFIMTAGAFRGGPLAGRYDTVQSHGLSGGTIFTAYNEQSYQRFRKEYERPIQRRCVCCLINGTRL